MGKSKTKKESKAPPSLPLLEPGGEYVEGYKAGDPSAELNIRFAVTLSYSITLSIDTYETLNPERLKYVLGQHIDRWNEDGGTPNAIDKIEICEVATGNDGTIVAADEVALD